ncbi:MAG TPA: DUF4394 domain-containing protein [Polyangiaceae bacterium]|nr:DUF4394 domain-containing protein [Polyangiaceae bacterium]
MMKRGVSCLSLFLLTVAAAAAPACTGDDGPPPSRGVSGSGGAPPGGAPGGADVAAASPPATPDAFDVLALGEGNKVFYFKSDDPGSAKQATIAGADADFEGIDLRPSDGLIYGLTGGGELYKLDVELSGDDLVVRARAGAEVGGLAVGEGGVAFDFNPKSAIPADKGGDGGNALRLIAEATNYRLNPVNASIAGKDSPLAYKAGDENEGKEPGVVAAAYTNAFRGAAGTTLYDIDVANGTLVRQGDPDPNLGVLTTVGPLGEEFGDALGFDIVTTAGPDGVVDAGFLVHGETFYSIGLRAGGARPIGAVAGASGLRGVVVMVPTAR